MGLDRDGLGALARGLENYQGGVVIIHNEEFCNSVCQQKWIMDGGRLREEGEIQLDEDTIQEQAGADELFDESGNKIDVSKTKTMAVKDVEKRLKDNAKKKNLGEEEVWELQDKLEQLKQTLAIAK